MHTIVSILVLLSPLLVFLSLPVFVAVFWAGVRALQRGTPRRGASIGFIVVGGLGLLLDAATVAFVALDNPHARAFDSIDSGPLTGVPTIFVVFLSVFTIIVFGWLGRSLIAQQKIQG